MQLPVNAFKQAIRARERPQIGLWLGLGDAYAAEIAAGAGFDWLVLDAEHSPNDVPRLLAQLQAIAGYPVAPIVRAASDSVVHLKQLLDLGAQTLIVPMIEDGAQAEALVRATRYPPVGVRGVGSALTRAARWGRIPDYTRRADEQLCVIAQIESPRGLENLKAIATTPGIDGVFIGPADLSAALGHRDDPGHGDVQTAITTAVNSCRALQVPVGIISADETVARHYLGLGVAFIAVGLDTALYARATTALAQRFLSLEEAQAPSGAVY